MIEGNRRLTAVKLLRNPELIPSRRRLAETAAEAQIRAPEKLPVIIHKTREEVLPYLGSRHIAGVRQWESIAKAKYIYQLFEKLTNSTAPVEDRYRQIAKKIGSRKDFIQRNLDAYAVYKVIERNEFYNIPDLSEESINFSVLSTAIAYPRIGSFVGATKFDIKEGTFESNYPISFPENLKPEEIEELTRWSFEKLPDGTVRLGESRNLKLLAHIVVTPKALNAFRAGAEIGHAYRLTIGVDEEFTSLLHQILNSLRQASGMVANAGRKREHLDLAQDAFDQIKFIRSTIREKVEGDDD